MNDTARAQPQPSGEAELLHHFATFESLTLRALTWANRSRASAAAVGAQTAAAYAYFHHPGVWSSSRLEAMLAGLGRPVADEPRRTDPGSRRRVLHVMTRVAAIGGHSRMVWRWMSLDDESSHSVVLTRQGALPVPDALTSAVVQRGGSLVILNRRPGTALTWARELRRIALNYDVILLHIFAEDVIPLIAFGNRTNLPPVVFIDQADHAFSIGATTADLYVALRGAGAQLAIERRGVSPSRVAELPITLGTPVRTQARERAKAELGIDPSSVMLLSIARAPKYTPFRGEHYADALEPVITNCPESNLIVIGPGDDARWSELRSKTGGRVQVFNERSDTRVFYEAADIYVDSFPAISNTSLLEAGSYGTALVSRCVHPGPHTIYCAGAPGLDPVVIRADRDGIASELERLIRDPQSRLELGDRTQRSIAGTHGDEGWRRALARLYDRAQHTDAMRPSHIATRDPATPSLDPVDLVWNELFGSSVALADVRSWFVKGLPLDLRIRAVAELSAGHGRLRPELLVPEWLTGNARLVLERGRRLTRHG